MTTEMYFQMPSDDDDDTASTTVEVGETQLYQDNYDGYLTDYSDIEDSDYDDDDDDDYMSVDDDDDTSTYHLINDINTNTTVKSDINNNNYAVRGECKLSRSDEKNANISSTITRKNLNRQTTLPSTSTGNS